MRIPPDSLGRSRKMLLEIFTSWMQRMSTLCLWIGVGLSALPYVCIIVFV